MSLVRRQRKEFGRLLLKSPESKRCRPLARFVRRAMAIANPVQAGGRLANYLSVMTMKDLAALTMEATAKTQVPLAGTARIPGTPY